METHCTPDNPYAVQLRANFLYTKMLALWVCTFWRTKGFHWIFPIIESSNSFVPFLSPGSILVQCTTHSFKIRQSWKWKAERILSKSKRVIQSLDPADMILVLVQSRNSNQDVCHYVPLLLQRNHVVLHLF